MISRVFGYVRDAALAGVLGAAFGMDAFTIAFRLANLFRRLVGEGSMTTAFIPVYTQYRKNHSDQESWQFVSTAFYTLGALLLCLVIATIFLSPLLVRVMAPGFYQIPGKFELTTFLNQLMAPFLLLIGLGSLLMGVLNAHGSFSISAFAPLMLNLSIIAATLGIAPHMSYPSVGVAYGVLLGGVLQFVVQLPAAIQKGMRLHFHFSLKHPAIQQMAKMLGPSLLGLGVVQLNLLVDSLIGSFLIEGSVSSLYYSSRVTELAIGVNAVAVATVILPALSEAAHDRNFPQMTKLLTFGLRQVAFIVIPAAIGLMVLAQPIITVLFEHGEFMPEDTIRTAGCLVLYASGLFFVGGLKVLAPASYALMDTKTPVKCAFIALLVNIVFNLILMKPLGVSGIALATAISAAVNFLLLYGLLRKQLQPINWKPFLSSMGRIVFSGMVMAGMAWGVMSLSRFDRLMSKWQQAGWLSVCVIVCALGYFLAMKVLRSPELNEWKNALARRKTNR